MERHSAFVAKVCAHIFGSKSHLFDSISWRNVPGVALYMTSLTQLRTVMATTPYFQKTASTQGTHSVLPKLTVQGNLLSGATARVAVGFLLNPVSVLKARFEVNYLYHKFSLSHLISRPEQHIRLWKLGRFIRINRSPWTLRASPWIFRIVSKRCTLRRTFRSFLWDY